MYPSQGGQMQGGPQGMIPLSSNPPMHQMAGLSLGPQGYQPPPGPPSSQPFTPATSYAVPSMNHATTTGPPAGNFPQRSSQYNQPEAWSGQPGQDSMPAGPPMGQNAGPPMGQNAGPPMGPNSRPPVGQNAGPQMQMGPPMGRNPGPPMGQNTAPPMGQNYGPPVGQNYGPQMVPPVGRNAGPPMGQNIGPPMGQNTGPPMGQNTGPSMGQNTGPPMGQNTGPSMGQNTGPPMGQNTGPPMGQNTGPPMGQNTGPPMGQNTGPPMGQNIGPPMGQNTGPPMGLNTNDPAPYMPNPANYNRNPSMPGQGPSGMLAGPPGQPGMPGGPTGLSRGPPEQPGVLMGPPGMSPGPPRMGTPEQRPRPPLGPPGVSMAPPGPPGMAGQPGPPGMSMGPPGMSMGPPGPPGMSMGPPGMSTGPPGPQGMSMGPPGMSAGGPGPPGMSMGPPGMSMGPPGHPGMSMGTPGMSAGAPGPPGMSMGPPGMSAGGPGPPGMSMGPPGSPGMAMGPGAVQQQPSRTKIDPDQMPNPVEVMRTDQEQRGGSTPYRTSTRGVPPPLVSTEFAVQDDGNASPRYMRATMYTVPCSKDMLNNCKIPLGLVMQPFACVPQDENTLHLVDHGSSGPIRCNRCKAYMNPYARFVDGGRRYLCPICQCSNEVSAEYFCHLDHQGHRTDAMQRPELCFGSVEYAATKDYCKEGKAPRSPAYIFMIDVSYGNVQAGLTHLLFNSILGVLDDLPGSSEEGGSPIKVGFVTYDRVIQFYNVKASMTQPQMMVLTDVDDVFVPLVEGFLVSLNEARTVLESLMSQLPEIFSSNKTPQVVLEPVVRAGMEALKAAGRNGRLFVFHSSLPSAQSTGMLKNRLDTKLLGTDKEKNLLNAASSPYQKLAEDCVKHGVGVELFVFPSSYCDVATLGAFVANTGGELHYYKNYTNKDGSRLMKDLHHSLTRPTGFDCVMRVRSSTGLRPTGFYGAFFMNNTTDIELGNIDCDKAIAVEIKHDDKLRDDESAFFQAALLYTDIYGRRKLRIHNLSLNCSSKFPDIYRSCEIDTIVSFLAKSILTASLTMPYKSIRESFSHQCAVILSCYRKHCSSQSPPGQLILPESLKLLPVYANCILKSDALLSPPIVSMDEKCWLMHCLLSMPTTLGGPFIYPRMFSLHDLDVDQNGLPLLIRCTGQKLVDSGLFIVENGMLMVMWIGLQFPLDNMQKIFGVPSQAQISPEMHALPALDNPLSFRVRGILEQLQSSCQHSMKLIVTKQKDKSEIFFRRLLKEDKGSGQWEGITYIEYLCQIHREIKEILS